MLHFRILEGEDKVSVNWLYVYGPVYMFHLCVVCSQGKNKNETDDWLCVHNLMFLYARELGKPIPVTRQIDVKDII